MNRKAAAIAALLLLGFLLVSCVGAVHRIPPYRAEIQAEVVQFVRPSPRHWTLPNGLSVYFQPQDELPVVRGTLYLPGGELYDASGIAGLASAAGAQMRSGGVEGITADELDRRIDHLAAVIESDFGREYGTISFSCLAEDFAEVFGLFARVVLSPAFDETRFTLWQKVTADKIAHRRDRPDVIADMALKTFLYGADSPQARVVSRESLGRITVDEMRRFHRRFVQPDRAVFALSGAVTETIVRSVLAEHLGRWARGNSELPALPVVAFRPVPGIYVLPRKLDQATVAIGHQGPPRHTHDQYAIAVYNRIVGEGGFGTELFSQIRSRRGLAYYIAGGVWPAAGGGLVQVDFSTKPEEAARAIDESLRVIEKSRLELFDVRTLEQSKAAITRSFLFKFAEPEAVVERAAMLQILGYEADYDARFLANIAAVTGVDVLAAAKSRIHPDNFVVVVVGDVAGEQLNEGLRAKLPVFHFMFDDQPVLLE